MDQKSIELSPDDRQQLNEIFQVIGLTQTELAQLADVSQSWLSQSVFNATRPSTNKEMLERVVNIMLERLKDRQPDSEFSEERTRTAITFLGHVATAGNTFNPAQLYPPGGIVPINATHYIERDADVLIKKALQRPPVTILVRGPVQCGKSSLLARLEQEAIKQGTKTAWFDPATVPKAKYHDDLSINSAIALCEVLQEKWRLAPPRGEIKSITEFINWLIRALAPIASEHRLLILDNLVRLGPLGVEDWLSSIVREMSNRRSKVGGAQVSIAVGLTYQFGPDFARRFIEQSSVVAWWPKIELGWFDLDQVSKMVRVIKKGVSLFDVDYFEDSANLISKLKIGIDPLSNYLRDQFTPVIRQLLEAYTLDTEPDQNLKEVLVDELNNMLKGTSLYEADRFKDVELTEETQTLISQIPRGEELIRLNRILLEEAYLPSTEAKSKTLFELFGGQPFLTHAAAMDDSFRGCVEGWTCNESESSESKVQENPTYRQHRNAIRFAILGPGWDVDELTKNLLESFVKICSGGGTLKYNDEIFLGASRLIQEAASFEKLKKTGFPQLIKVAETDKQFNAKLPIYRLMAKDFNKVLEG